LSPPTQSILKVNQSTLHDDVVLIFENTARSYTLNTDKAIDKGHGRIEKRLVTLGNEIDWLTKAHSY